MTYDYTHFNEDRSMNELGRAMRAQLEIMGLAGKKLAEEYRQQVASTLLTASLTLIPSDHLQDHQFVVSRAVYEAAKRMVGPNP